MLTWAVVWGMVKLAEHGRPIDAGDIGIASLLAIIGDCSIVLTITIIIADALKGG